MAAADYRWISTDGDWGASSSWDQGGVPNATDPNDHILFDGTVQTSAVLNVDRSGDANTCDQITVMPEFTGNIGTLGNPLHIEVDTVTGGGGTSQNFTHRGTGTVYLTPLIGQYMDIVVDSPNMAKAMQLISGRVRHLFIKRGHVHVSSTTLITGHVELLGPHAILTTVAADSTERTGDTFIMLGGYATNARAFVENGNAFVLGGTLEQTGVLSATNNIFNLGGTVIYKPAAASANAIDLFAVEGFTDLTQSQFTPSWASIVVGPNADILGNPFTGAEWSATGVTIDLREDYP